MLVNRLATSIATSVVLFTVTLAVWTIVRRSNGAVGANIDRTEDRVNSCPVIFPSVESDRLVSIGKEALVLLVNVSKTIGSISKTNHSKFNSLFSVIIQNGTRILRAGWFTVSNQECPLTSGHVESNFVEDSKRGVIFPHRQTIFHSILRHGGALRLRGTGGDNPLHV